MLERQRAETLFAKKTPNFTFFQHHFLRCAHSLKNYNHYNNLISQFWDEYSINPRHRTVFSVPSPAFYGLFSHRDFNIGLEDREN